MNKKIKYSSFLALVFLTIFLFTSCSPVSTNLNYELDVQVAGNGEVRDDYGNIITTSNSRNRITVDSNTIVEINANEYTSQNSEFLFWTGDTDDYILSSNQSIYMDSDKQLISVFGNPDNVFIAGDITQSWGNSNVIGYWKALMDYPNLEVYVREKSGQEKAVRYIFDQGEFENDPYEGRVVYKQPELTSTSQYIAAIKRIEESNVFELGTEATRYIFVYVEPETHFRAMISEDKDFYTSFINDYGDADQQTFMTQVKNVIDEYENANNNNEKLIYGNRHAYFEHEITQ